MTLPVVHSPQRNPNSQTQFRPLITVVIAVRNGADMLQRCLDSIFEQRYDRVELVVMDGASSDGTQAILERNTSRIHYWETEPDRGIYHAWNKALDHTHGDWICFLGADDRYRDPDALGRMATALTEDGGRHRIAYTTLDIVDHAGAVIRTLGMPWDLARRDVQSGMSLPHPSTTDPSSRSMAASTRASQSPATTRWFSVSFSPATPSFYPVSPSLKWPWVVCRIAKRTT